jgi:hypothetical protein
LARFSTLADLLAATPEMVWTKRWAGRRGAEVIDLMGCNKAKDDHPTPRQYYATLMKLELKPYKTAIAV